MATATPKDPVSVDEKKNNSKTSSVSSLSDKKGAVSVETKSALKDDLVDEEPKPFRWTNHLRFFGKKKEYVPFDPDAISTRRSVYDDPILAEHYMPTEKYENLHRFDISARWTYREEAVSCLST